MSSKKVDPITFYLNLSSEDLCFESIFIREAIFPNLLNSKTALGAMQTFVSMGEHDQDWIEMTKNPSSPKEQLGKLDVRPFWVSLSSEDLDKRFMKIVDPNICRYYGPIFLQPERCKILFQNEKDQDFLINRAITFRQCKGFGKYRQRFGILQESKKRKRTQLSEKALGLQEVSFVQLVPVVLVGGLWRHNFIKGALLGLGVGVLRSYSIELFDLASQIQATANAFQFLQQADKKDKYYENTRIETADRIEKIITTLPAWFPQSNSPLESVVDRLVKFLGEKESAQGSWTKLLNFLELEVSIGIIDKLDDHLVKNGYLGLSIPKLRKVADQIKESSNIPEPEFSSAFALLSKAKDVVDQEVRIYRPKNIHPFKGIELSLNSMSFSKYGMASCFRDVEPEETDSFDAILSHVLKWRVEHPQSSYVDLISTLKALSSKLLVSQAASLKSAIESMELGLLVNLRSIQSPSVQNLYCVLTMIDNHEKMTNSLNTSGVKFQWMAYAFYGAITGFSALGRGFLEQLYEYGLENQLGELDRIMNYSWLAFEPIRSVQG